MKTNLEKDNNQTTPSGSTPLNDFNFEQWAKQVRPLLLASLQKRGK